MSEETERIKKERERSLKNCPKHQDSIKFINAFYSGREETLGSNIRQFDELMQLIKNELTQ